MPPQQES
jgi:hypothetical protein